MKRIKAVGLISIMSICILLLISSVTFAIEGHGGHSEMEVQQTDIHSNMSTDEMNQHSQINNSEQNNNQIGNANLDNQTPSSEVQKESNVNKSTQETNVHKSMSTEEMNQHSDVKNADNQVDSSKDNTMQVQEDSHGSSAEGHSEAGSHSGKNEGTNVDFTKRKLVAFSFFSVIAAVIIIAGLTKPKNKVLKKGAI